MLEACRGLTDPQDLKVKLVTGVLMVRWDRKESTEILAAPVKQGCKVCVDPLADKDLWVKVGLLD